MTAHLTLISNFLRLSIPLLSTTTAFEDILTPPWLREKPHTKEPQMFHFSKLKRKEDLKKFRKQRRREWMMKAYLIAQGADDVNRAAESDLNYVGIESNTEYEDESQMLQQIEQRQYNNIRGDDGEGKTETFEAYSKQNSFYTEADIPDEDILKWSMSLDFDDYSRDWMATGTSLPSDITFSSVYLGSVSGSTMIPSPAAHPNAYNSQSSSIFRNNSKYNVQSVSLPKIV